MKKNLIICNSGGSGHVQATAAIKKKLEKEGEQVSVYDVVIDWWNKPFGKYFLKIWDNAQKKGRLSLLLYYPYGNLIFEGFFGWIVAIKAYRSFQKKQPDRVIDTQPIATKWVLWALKRYNKKHGKNLLLEKILFEFPTPKTEFYFKRIRKLSEKNRALLKFYTHKPLLQKEESEQDFWKKYCKMQENQFVYDPFFIREEFIQLQKTVNSVPSTVQHEKRPEFSLLAEYQTEEQRVILESALKEAGIAFQKEQKKQLLSFSIAKEDHVSAILLASNPEGKALLTYIQKIAEAKKSARLAKKRQLLFLFCYEEKMMKKVLQAKTKHHNLQIIPLPKQSDAFIAPLFSRCDLTITRSGGMTASELHAVSKGKIYIHSLLKGKNHSQMDLLKGMPAWEAGNALYLMEKKGAKAISTDSFSKHFEVE